MIRGIASNVLPPFGGLLFRFPPIEGKPADLAEVQLLTGVNGTGKTRLLALLAAMLGNTEPLNRRLRNYSDAIVVRASQKEVQQGAIGAELIHKAGDQFTANAQSAAWNTSKEIAAWCQRVPAFAYSGSAYVGDRPIAVLAGVEKPQRTQCLSFTRPTEESGGLLQAIANLKVQTAMDSMNDSPAGHDSASRAGKITAAVENCIREITGRNFGFQVASYPKPWLGVRWGANLLPFDLLPDGLRSIIGWLVHAVVMMDAWVQGEKDPFSQEAVFLLDEIESHLHPAWQRRILPAFQRLFPKAQIFIATHSPFVIASLNHGWIHRLTLDPDGRVRNEAPIAASAGDSVISVIEDIMGVPEWYDPETEDLLALFRKERDAAYRGDAPATGRARELAATIGARSHELHYLMGRELAQMDRQLSQPATAK